MKRIKIPKHHTISTQLIIASPYLLEACKEALPLLKDEWCGTDEHSIGNKVIKKIEQAISKAEGD